MQRADALVGKTLKIIEWFHEAEWAVENPASSRLWKRAIASELAKKSWVTSCCAFGYNYKKNTRISYSKPLTLPVCGGVGVCPAMVGSSHLGHAQQGHRKRHKEHAQKGGGGTLNVYHTRNQLHSIPPGLIELILSQVFPTDVFAACLTRPLEMAARAEPRVCFGASCFGEAFSCPGA